MAPISVREKTAKETTSTSFEREKFKELVLYVCFRCENPSYLGSTKLNKILWFSDLLSYVNTGKSITGEKYIKRQFGPVPEHILEIVESLEQEQALITRDVQQFNYPKKDYIALKKPDIKNFTPEEISIVDQTIDVICFKHTAESISEATHNEIWKLAEIGEEIPLSTVFGWKLGEVNEHDISWAKQALSSSAT